MTDNGLNQTVAWWPSVCIKEPQAGNSEGALGLQLCFVPAIDKTYITAILLWINIELLFTSFLHLKWILSFKIFFIFQIFIWIHIFIHLFPGNSISIQYILTILFALSLSLLIYQHHLLFSINPLSRFIMLSLYCDPHILNRAVYWNLGLELSLGAWWCPKWNIWKHFQN